MRVILLNEPGCECYTNHSNLGIIMAILDLMTSQEAVLQSSDVYMVMYE